MQTGAISSGFSLEFAHPQDTHSLHLEEGRGIIYTSALVCFTLIDSTTLIMTTLPMWFAISGAVLVIATALYLRAQPSSNSAGRPIDYLEESEQSSNLTISTNTRQTATLSPIPTPPLPELPNPANNISEEVKTHLVPLLENTGTLVSTKLLIPLEKVD